MPGPDYLQFRQSYRNSLIHSPKGTTWKNHKYLIKDGNRYIYKELQKKIHVTARDVRDNIKALKDSAVDTFINTLDDKEPYLESGWESIKTVLKNIDYAKPVKSLHEFSTEIVDRGWEAMESVLHYFNGERNRKR